MIDSAAEVPPHVVDNPHVRLLPVCIRIGDKTYIDERKPAATRGFNSRVSTCEQPKCPNRCRRGP